MNKTFYEEMLSKHIDRNIDAEKMWDERAGHFNSSQDTSHSGFSKRVVELLDSKNLLNDANVLDIGGGGGRYAIPFAKRAKRVTMTDISGNMISFAREKAEKEGLTNLDFIKMNWENADLNTRNMSKRYDLVFASMCPAIKSKEGLENMIRASNDHCFVAQMILDTDTFTDFIAERAQLEKGYHPHNDRDSVIAIFNLLWLDGYSPEINYLDDSVEFTLSIDDLKQSYTDLLERAQTQADFNLDSAIKEYCEEEMIKITHNRTLAMISWNV